MVSTTLPSAGVNGTFSARRRRMLVPNEVLGMWLFLFTEIMLFLGLISAYLVLRGQTALWPPPGQPRLPVEITAINTLILLASGLTMWQAVPALRRGGGRLLQWLWLTFFLGLTFLAIQGYEWLRLIGFGLTTRSSIYGGMFYTLIGVHGLHVLGALIVLALVMGQTRQGHYTVSDHGGLLAMRLYWSFVVLVWPVLYVLVYLV